MKNINTFLFVVIPAVLCLFLGGCEIQMVPPSLKVVNRYEQPITTVTIRYTEYPSTYFSFVELNIRKGKSETFRLDDYPGPLSAEVYVFFDSKYSTTAALRFNPAETTTVTLNENGILE